MAESRCEKSSLQTPLRVLFKKDVLQNTTKKSWIIPRKANIRHVQREMHGSHVFSTSQSETLISIKYVVSLS